MRNKSGKRGTIVAVLMFVFLICGFRETQAAQQEPVTQPEAAADLFVQTKALSSQKLEVSWNGVSGAFQYIIARSTAKTTGYREIATLPADARSYTDRTMQPGKTYYYRVTPMDSTGQEISASILTAKGRVPQKAVVKDLAAKSESKLTIYWKESRGADGYEVYRSNKKDGSYQMIKELEGREETAYTDSTVVPGKTYYYKIRPVNIINGVKGQGSNSKAVQGKTVDRPKLTSVASKNSRAMRLTWKKVSGAQAYEIYRSTKEDSKFQRIATVKGSKKEYIDTKVKEGKKYYYKLRAIGTLNGKKITSGYSSAMGSRTLKQSKISSISRTKEDYNKIKWKAVKGVKGYKIYRATKANGSYKKIATVDSKATSYTDKKITVGKTYYYKIQAFTKSGGVTGNGDMSGARAASANYMIMGESTVTVDQMVKFYNNVGRRYPSSVYKEKGAKNIKKFCEIVLDESEKEGVRAEVIFAQICLETGYLQFGGQVNVAQCNFSGLGATDDGAAGATFPNVRIGIRAQVQHLKAYASTESLNQECVDPRFRYLANRRGSAPCVENLGNGNWATDPNYSSKLLNMIKGMKQC